jgi:hypothetical protein
MGRSRSAVAAFDTSEHVPIRVDSEMLAVTPIPQAAAFDTTPIMLSLLADMKG